MVIRSIKRISTNLTFCASKTIMQCNNLVIFLCLLHVVSKSIAKAIEKKKNPNYVTYKDFTYLSKLAAAECKFEQCTTTMIFKFTKSSCPYYQNRFL